MITVEKLAKALDSSEDLAAALESVRAAAVNLGALRCLVSDSHDCAAVQPALQVLGEDAVRRLEIRCERLVDECFEILWQGTSMNADVRGERSNETLVDQTRQALRAALAVLDRSVETEPS